MSQTMQLKDASLWQKCLDNNTDPYRSGIMEFANRWAIAMEAQIANGATVASCAKETSHQADTDGITGFMYGAAVKTLASVWIHGEDLRRWSNIDLQIADEGEKANANGGVLNPALLQIGPG